MALLQESVKKDVYPRVILKRLCESLTHPYQCSECPQRFHKLYDATAHYLITHQDSNEVKEDKVPKEELCFPRKELCFPKRNYVSRERKTSKNNPKCQICLKTFEDNWKLK